MPWRTVVGDVGQWAGMAAGVGGVVCELVAHADVGYAIITGAAVIYAVATKVKYYSRRTKHHDVSRFPFR